MALHCRPHVLTHDHFSLQCGNRNNNHEHTLMWSDSPCCRWTRATKNQLPTPMTSIGANHVWCHWCLRYPVCAHMQPTPFWTNRRQLLWMTVSCHQSTSTSTDHDPFSYMQCWPSCWSVLLMSNLHMWPCLLYTWTNPFIGHCSVAASTWCHPSSPQRRCLWSCLHALSMHPIQGTAADVAFTTDTIMSATVASLQIVWYY